MFRWRRRHEVQCWFPLQHTLISHLVDHPEAASSRQPNDFWQSSVQALERQTKICLFLRRVHPFWPVHGLWPSWPSLLGVALPSAHPLRPHSGPSQDIRQQPHFHKQLPTELRAVWFHLPCTLVLQEAQLQAVQMPSGHLPRLLLLVSLLVWSLALFFSGQHQTADPLHASSPLTTRLGRRSQHPS